MKYILLSSIFFVTISKAQVAINTDATNADASSLLDVKSTQKGVLLPRMLKSEKNAIVSPATGLLIYQTGPDSSGYYVFNGTNWELFVTTGGVGTNPNVGLKARPTNNITLPTSTFTTLVDFAEFYENGGNNFDPLTGVYTVPSTGVYHFSIKYNIASIGAATATNTPITLRVYAGASIIEQTTRKCTLNSGFIDNLTLSFDNRLTQGQLITFQIQQLTGSDIVLAGGSGSVQSTISIHKVY